MASIVFDMDNRRIGFAPHGQKYADKLSIVLNESVSIAFSFLLLSIGQVVV